MKKSNIKTLHEIRKICAKLGSNLDGTATHPAKMFHRVQAHRDISDAIYWLIYLDHPENDQIEEDREAFNKSMNWLRWVALAQYTDRNGKGVLNNYDENLVYPEYEYSPV